MEGKVCDDTKWPTDSFEKSAIAIHFQADLSDGLLHNSFENDQDEI